MGGCSLIVLFEPTRNFIYRLLSDAAKYLVAAGVVLKSLYPSCFMRHALCMLRNCAMTVRSHFKDSNYLIFRGQISENKNKTCKAKIAARSSPSKPVFTRWGSRKLAKCDLICKKNKPEVKAIVKRFEGAGVLIIQAKVSSNAWFSKSASQNQSTTLLS